MFSYIDRLVKMTYHCLYFSPPYFFCCLKNNTPSVPYRSIFQKKNCLKKIHFYIFKTLFNEKLYFSKNTIMFNKISLVKSYWEQLIKENNVLENIILNVFLISVKKLKYGSFRNGGSIRHTGKLFFTYQIHICIGRQSNMK